MVVVRGDKGIDGDDAVAARAVFDNDRLFPALRQPVGEQARADIGAAAGAERQNEFDRTCRPSRVGRRSVRAGDARQPTIAAATRPKANPVK